MEVGYMVGTAACLETYATRCLLDVLYEDVLVRICRFLPATSLVASGVTCSEFHGRTQESIELWKGLCSFTLGEASLILHEKCLSSVVSDLGSVGFYQRLFQAAWSCKNFCYDHDCREQLLSSISKRSSPSTSDDAVHDALCMSGHTSEALGPFVLQIGGMRNKMTCNDVVHVTAVNIESRCILRPKLSSDSLKPAQRMRHTTCAVRAPCLPSAAVPEAILVLGGHDGNIRSASAGTPRASVKNLLFLQLTCADGSEVRWSEETATGIAPTYIYNHACVVFGDGRRVCVFGGDIPTSDSEYARIRHRQACNFVYILDLWQRHWEVVTTSGEIPMWRSFHAAVSYTSLLDGIEYLVTFGGTDEHCEPLSGGSLADMRGYQLNLHTFSWCRGPDDGFMPSPRMRFGVARWGRHLILHGGHGQVHGGLAPHGDPWQVREGIARLSLSTLRWGTLSFSNEPPPLPRSSFETGSPVAGCVIGGAQQTILGPNILSRLVIFRLRDTSVDDDGIFEARNIHERDAHEDVMVRVRIGGTEAEPRSLLLPAHVLASIQREAGENTDVRRFLRQYLIGDPSDSEDEAS